MGAMFHRFSPKILEGTRCINTPGALRVARCTAPVAVAVDVAVAAVAVAAVAVAVVAVAVAVAAGAVASKVTPLQ